MNIQNHVNSFLKQTLDANYKSASRWIVGFSGGVDSCVLLHLLAALRLEYPKIEIVALHINHQINPDSQHWQEKCQAIAQALSVPFISHTVNVDNQNNRGLEDAARQARYQAFEQTLKPGDVLFLAHHQDDQAETLLFRLLRGAGPTGLAAMLPVSCDRNYLLARPLLAVGRDEILQYAEANKLTWVDDPSNEETRFDRNYLRHEVMAKIRSRWPQASANIARSAQLIQQANQLLELSYQPIYANICESEQHTLDLAQLNLLDEHAQKYILRMWINKNGTPYPSEIMLDRIVKEVIHAKIDAQPVVQFGQWQVRRYDGRLYLMGRLADFNNNKVMSWSMSEELKIAGLGMLCAKEKRGEGLRLASQGRQVKVKFRAGGETCRPHGKGKSQSLKKLMQEYRILPWLRDRTPLVYYDEELVAVIGGWICEGYQVAEDEMGYCIEIKK